jgi:nucleoside-diphosphate-sugar epimerase
MDILVTGVAGFIGSSLASRLLKEGHTVIGIDCFTSNYPRKIKETYLKELLSYSSFSFTDENLSTCSLPRLFAEVDVCYHQAAQPGVRSSWGATFDLYIKHNIQVTQRLLEHIKENPIQKFVFASTSSVYGDGPLPMHEEQQLKPVSPYGVTKLAAENLCYLYYKNHGVPFTAFRYFTVYGPKQRPDMAFHIFIKAILKREEIQIFGDGYQTRDFTYIDDVIEANLANLKLPCQGEIYNLGGGSRVSIREVISLLEDITGISAKVNYIETQKGDARHTFADTSKAKKAWGFNPRFDLRKGLIKEVEWVESLIAGGFYEK